MSESANSSGITVGYGAGYGGNAGGGGRPSAVRSSGRVLGGLLGGGLLAASSLVLLGLYYREVRRAATAEGVQAAQGEPAPSAGGEALLAPLESATLRFLDAPVTLRFDGKSFQTSWRKLGLTLDRASLAREAARLAEDGVHPQDVDAEFFVSGKGRRVPVAISREQAVWALVAYKDDYDRPAEDARIDLEKRQIIPERTGYGIHVYDSLALVEERARTGAHEIELVGGETQPQVTRAQLGDLDISHVLGTFETRYVVSDKDRNYNLKLAAEKLNGHILMPGQEFSFNAVVGDRTEKEGFRVAHVIEGGEMVDGLAGGTCQISSTLHGAAWFAGLDILHSIPHSRPSTYITMGLDATVVYPTTDLKLKNPYDFPVVIRYVVAQGSVKVEILGKKRPWDRIEFEREVKQEIPYQTITREDHELPVGTTLVDQIGFPGYELVRKRNFYKGKKLVKSEKWTIKYPPTTEYLRIGTNPDPNLVPPKQEKLHGLKPPKEKIYRQWQ